MSRYKTNDPNIHLIDTGRIIVHNYPAKRGTAAYVCRVYREVVRGKNDSREVSGEPVFFDQMTDEMRALAIVIGEAQNALKNTLPRESYLQPIKSVL